MMTCSILLSFILAASFYGAVVSSSDEPIRSNAGEDPLLMKALVGKRDSFKKLRPQNPLLIYHQSIRQPAFPSGRFMVPRTMSADSGDGLLAVTSGGGTAHHHDIPRRLIRRNPHRNQVGRLMEAAGTSTGNAKPPASYFVWNHQLLPSFYSSKHLPAEIKNFRREQQQLYSSNNKKWKRASDVESPWSVPEDLDLTNDLEMIPSNPEQKLKDKKIHAEDFFNEQGAAESQEFDDYY